MPLAFDQWLAKPSTTCLLRRVLSTTHGRDNGALRRSGFEFGAGPRRHITAASAVAREPGDVFNDSKLEKSEHGWRFTPIDPEDTSGAAAQHLSPRASIERTAPDFRPDRAFKSLSKQVNVASTQRHGSSVVDSTELQINLNLWIELLQYRQRVDGVAGTLDIWREMRSRGVDLPTTGPEADVLWTAFINASISDKPSKAHRELFDGVVDHIRALKERLNVHYDGLYLCIVGRWLRVNPPTARVWHRLLPDQLRIPATDPRCLADDCAVSIKPEQARKTFFKYIRNSTDQSGLYDAFVPTILKHRGRKHALAWHRDFLANGDGPSADVFAMPGVQRLFDEDGNKSLPMIHRKHTVYQSDATRSNKQHEGLPRLDRATMSTLVGDVHGIKPKQVSDSFVARMFATRAFPIDLVIHGLGFFGVESLGPLAMREMALRTSGSDDFCNKLAKVKSMKIRVDDTVYGRLIEQLATVSSPELFDTLLASDQHPEEFGDTNTQSLLLDMYLEKRDSINIYITLIALSLGGRMENVRAWNVVLQYYIRAGDSDSITRILQQMQQWDLKITRTSVHLLRHDVLPKRHPSKAPITSSVGHVIPWPLQCTTTAYMHAAQKGTYIHPDHWVEVLKQYGMMQRWDELDRVVRWLFSIYASRQGPIIVRRGTRQVVKQNMLQAIFSDQMQKALVAWAFRDAASRQLLRQQPFSVTTHEAQVQSSARPWCEPWARGLLLLRDLARGGMDVRPGVAKSALSLRLWILFGPGYSTRAINEMALRSNEIPLAHYIRHANGVWQEKLFDIDSSLLDDAARYPELLVAVFGAQRRVSRKKQEYADIVGYVQSGLSQQHVCTRTNAWQRERKWQYSPFRLLRRVKRSSVSAAPHGRSAS